MPSLTDKSERHVVIDRRKGEYLCFPDVVRTDDGTLIVAYNENDRHIDPTRRVPLMRTSRDNGATWGDIYRFDVEKSHCPRLVKLAGNEIIFSDYIRVFHRSMDNGRTWQPFEAAGLFHDMIDRLTSLGGDSFLTTGHYHVGKPYDAIRQANTEQMAYRSDDHCLTWRPLGPIASERNLVLCEASMARLPDGRVLSLMRENSFVYEPMYLCISDNEGKTWSRPVETPLIGHRPTLGIISDGRLLVTYRNVGPDGGTAAWVGTLDELTSGFQVHGRHSNPENPAFMTDGLRIKNGAGDLDVVRYALRPMTDPRTATAMLEAEVRVDEAGTNGCGMRLGTWWRLYPDRIEAEVGGFAPVSIKPGFNTIHLDYAQGQVALSVNGEPRCAIEVKDDHGETRPILFGAPYPFEDNAVDCTWKRVRLQIDEPAMDRSYEWEWTPEDGLPDQWAQDTILELRNDRHAAFPDFGYSGWTEMEDGSFFCAYHHGGGTEPGYEPLHTAYVMGTRFSLDDFKK